MNVSKNNHIYIIEFIVNNTEIQTSGNQTSGSHHNFPIINQLHTAITFQQKWELLIIYILVLVNLSLLQMWELLLLGTAGTDALKLKSVTVY